LSKTQIVSDVDKAEELADRAVKLSERGNGQTLSNIVYYKLNQAICATFNLHFDKAKHSIKQALDISLCENDSMVLSGVYQTMSFFYSEIGEKNSALVCAHKALGLKPFNRNACLLALAHAYLDADSMRQAQETLKDVITNNPSELYSKYHALLFAYMQDTQKDSAAAYADTAFQTLENLYANALRDRDKHYAAIVKEENEKATLQSELKNNTKIMVVISISSLVVIGLILYALQPNKKIAKRRSKMESEKKEMELKHMQNEYEMEMRLQTEGISNKQTQLSIMRDFLLKKVDIMKRIDEIKPTKNDSHIILSENDWTEIETWLECVDNMFVSRLKKEYPDLREEDIRLFMLLRLKIPAHSLSLIYGISEKSIKQKLFLNKSKVGIDNGEISLSGFIESFYPSE